MKVYHGSRVIVEKPDIKHSRKRVSLLRRRQNGQRVVDAYLHYEGSEKL